MNEILLLCGPPGCLSTGQPLHILIHLGAPADELWLAYQQFHGPVEFRCEQFHVFLQVLRCTVKGMN